MATSGLFQQLMDQYKSAQEQNPEEIALQDHLAKLRSGLYEKVDQPSTKEALFRGLTTLAPMLAAVAVGGTRAGAEPGIQASRMLQAQYKDQDTKNEERVMRGRLSEIESATQGLSKYKDKRKAASKAAEFGITTGANLERLDETKRHNLATKGNATQRLAQGPKGAASDPFTATVGRESAKQYVKTQNQAKGLDDQLSRLQLAEDEFKNYTKQSPGGTGPIATFGGLKKYTSGRTQSLDAAFRAVNIRELAQTFQGMSRAIDSDTERRAWEAQSPNIANDDAANAQILLGSKAIAMKAQQEAAAQRDYVKTNGKMDANYESPIFGKTDSLVDSRTGQIVLVPKGARPEGLEPIDAYAARQFGTSKGRSSLGESKPKTVRQNGHTYTLNPETGEYE